WIVGRTSASLTDTLLRSLYLPSFERFTNVLCESEPLSPYQLATAWMLDGAVQETSSPPLISVAQSCFLLIFERIAFAADATAPDLLRSIIVAEWLIPVSR